MSDEAQRQYFNEWPPTSSATPGTGVSLFSTSTAAAAYDLQAGGSDMSMFDRQMVLLNTDAGNTCWVSFGAASSVPLDKTSTGGTTTSAATAAKNGIPLVAGARLKVRLDKKQHRYLYLQAAANTPLIAFYPGSQSSMGQQLPP